MNIRDTKNQFRCDVMTHDYEILEVNKLHLNVSTVRARVGQEMVLFGYSYRTILMFSFHGLNVITDEYYSNSSAKHKSQMQPHYNSVYLDQLVFNNLLVEVLQGHEITIPMINQIISRYNLHKIITKIEHNMDPMEYLQNTAIFGEYGARESIKKIIRSKLWHQDRVCLKNNDLIHITRLPSGVYKWSGSEKEYKNLSFLNKINLEEIYEIL
jgi:hypothetical protein